LQTGQKGLGDLLLVLVLVLLLYLEYLLKFIFI